MAKTHPAVFNTIALAMLTSNVGGAPPNPSVGDAVPLVYGRSSPFEITYTEPAIAVSPYSTAHPPQIIVGIFNSAEFEVYWAASSDGGTVFTPARRLTFPSGSCTTMTLATADPVAAASVSGGDLWVGGFSKAQMVIWRKPLLADLDIINPVKVACDLDMDKPWLAIGPSAVAPYAETKYGGYTRDGGATRQLRTIRSSAGDPPDGPWVGPPYPVNSDSGTNRSGSGIAVEVIPSGASIGRLVCASSEQHLSTVPEATFHDAGGNTAVSDWSNRTLLSSYGTAGTILGPGAPTGPIPGNVYVNSFPSVAIDPSDPSRVYIAFIGRDSVNSANYDIFIARSFNSGESFLPQNTIRVMDSQLRFFDASQPTDPNNDPATGEFDEWLVSIAIDDYGGINLLFMRSHTPDGTPNAQTRASVRYARFNNVATAVSGGAAFVANLTPTDNGGFAPWAGPGYEYHVLKTAGCYAHLVYAARLLPGGGGELDPLPILPTWNVYYRKVVVGPCLLDFVPDRVLSQEDIDAFEGTLLAGSPSADLNGDGFVDAQDRDSFYEAYIEGLEIRS